MSIEDNTALKCAREALTSIVLGYVACIIAALDRCDSKKALRLCQALHARIRRHLRVQRKLFEHALREELEAKLAMRRQVRGDLGGKPAMVKWEIRKRHGRKGARNPSTSCTTINQTDRSESRSREPGKVWVPCTDRSGNFRLASLQDGYIGSKRESEVTVRKVTVTKHRPLTYNPIEVTSEDLRDNRFDCADYYDPPPYVCRPPRGKGRLIERWPIH